MNFIFIIIVCCLFSLPGAFLWGWAFDSDKIGIAVFITSLICLLGGKK